MINIRHVDFDRKLAPSLVNSFLLDTVAKEKRPVILVVGSSLSWGFPFPEDSIYTHFLQNLIPEKKVVNASTIGDSPLETLGTLCLAEQLGIHVDVLIVEINISNFVKQDQVLSVTPPRCTMPAKEWTYLDRVVPYLSFYLQNPFGLSHLKIIYDEHNYQKGDLKFNYSAKKDNYFNTTKEFDQTFAAKKSVLLPLFATSKKLSSNVIFFIAPPNKYGVSLSQFKYDDIKYQIKKYTELCNSVGGIQCLDARFDLDKEFYRDITHLNIKGHENYAKYLAEKVTTEYNH